MTHIDINVKNISFLLFSSWHFIFCFYSLEFLNLLLSFSIFIFLSIFIFQFLFSFYFLYFLFFFFHLLILNCIFYINYQYLSLIFKQCSMTHIDTSISTNINLFLFHLFFLFSIFFFILLLSFSIFIFLVFCHMFFPFLLSSFLVFS